MLAIKEQHVNVEVLSPEKSISLAQTYEKITFLNISVSIENIVCAFPKFEILVRLSISMNYQRRLLTLEQLLYLFSNVPLPFPILIGLQPVQEARQTSGKQKVFFPLSSPPFPPSPLSFHPSIPPSLPHSFCLFPLSFPPACISQPLSLGTVPSLTMFPAYDSRAQDGFSLGQAFPLMGSACHILFLSNWPWREKQLPAAVLSTCVPIPCLTFQIFPQQCN